MGDRLRTSWRARSSINELQAEKDDRSHLMLRLETRTSGKNEVREVVETKDGDLDWLISVNGKLFRRTSEASDSEVSNV
jgi:hypothetical protein